MSQRTQELRDAVDNLIGVHKQWQEDENRPNPDATYWDAVDELFETFDNGDVPNECRKLAKAVEGFRVEVRNFEEREDVNEHYPDNPFWERYEDLVTAREVPVDDASTNELAPLEPIPVLHAQGVAHWQIAKMYGLKLANGEPAVHLVQRELDKPGSVIDDNWKDPRYKLLESRRAESAAAERQGKEKQAAKAKAASQACPETPRDLWEQNVAAAQAARMLKRPLVEVQELFEQFDAERVDENESVTAVDKPKPKRTAKKVKAKNGSSVRSRR